MKHKGHRAAGRLSKSGVGFVHWVVTQIKQLHIPDYANDCVPRGIFAAQTNPVAQRIFVREEAASQGLVNYDHGEVVGAILISDKPPFAQPQANLGKTSRGPSCNLGIRNFAGRRLVTTLDPELSRS